MPSIGDLISSTDRSRPVAAAAVATCLLVLASCGSSDDGSGTTAQPDKVAIDAAMGRLDLIQDAVDDWTSAASAADAHAAAEAARNLVTGPATMGSGDLDGDGEAHGLEGVGLLASADGDAGLASPLTGCAAVDRDVLGGDWSDAAQRWETLDVAIQEWRPDNNTFPSLPSHPQRIVGWATLTLASQSLEDAHEYASHAQLHVDVARDALETCD